jgi:hypothetical protein
MLSIQPTPSKQLVQLLEANEITHLIAARHTGAQQPFVPSEPLTVEDLKARAIQATEESQADKGIDHTLFTCGNCTTVWRSRGFTRCPTCARDVGTILFLDNNQRSDLHEIAYRSGIGRPPYTTEQVNCALDEFRALLDTYAPWYDKTSRKMIQACYEDLCRSGGTSPKVALAIYFFKEEWTSASDDEKTFCPE